MGIQKRGVKLGVKLLHENAKVPERARPGDAGLDLYSIEPVYLKPGQRLLVSTGVALEIPDGHVGLVHPRSGLAYKDGVTVLNTPGTIDSGYRGEVRVMLYNTSMKGVRLDAGYRIAQLVIQEYVAPQIFVVEELSETVRGDGGFGSSGV